MRSSCFLFEVVESGMCELELGSQMLVATCATLLQGHAKGLCCIFCDCILSVRYGGEMWGIINMLSALDTWYLLRPYCLCPLQGV